MTENRAKGKVHLVIRLQILHITPTNFQITGYGKQKNQWGKVNSTYLVLSASLRCLAMWLLTRRLCDVIIMIFKHVSGVGV